MKKSKFACRWTLFMIYEKSKYLQYVAHQTEISIMSQHLKPR